MKILQNLKLIEVKKFRKIVTNLLLETMMLLTPLIKLKPNNLILEFPNINLHVLWKTIQRGGGTYQEWGTTR